MKKSELRQIIREEIQKLMEAKKFTVTLKQMDSKYDHTTKKLKVYEDESFDSEQEAKQFVKKMMKKYKLKKHAGHIVNYSEGLELWTNF